MALEQQIAALVGSTGNLTQVVTDLIPTWQAMVDEWGLDVQTFIQGAAATRPLSANLLADTKRFEHICGGELNAPTAWDQGGISSPWWAGWQAGAAGTLSLEVVHAGDEVRLGELGLWPLGELEQLVRPTPHEEIEDYGVDVNILVLDFELTTPGTAHADGVQLTIGQGTVPYTSWNVGQFKTQTSVFVNVIEAAGDITFAFIDNRTWDLPRFGAAQVGQGWKHYAGSRDGFGEWDHSYFRSPTNAAGSLKLALALPYSGFGDHQGLPVWAGSLNYWDRDDYLAGGFVG